MADDTVTAVHSLGRRQLALQHGKLTQHVVAFTALFSTGSSAALSALPRVDEAFVALGTTIKVAGSQQAFRAIDFDAVIAIASAAKAAGATRLGVVSAMGANALSGVFYNRVKGEMENALASLGFTGLVIARPSFLAGNREALGQPARSGEKLALAVSRWLAPLIPDNYKSIDGTAVARALLRAVPSSRGMQVLESGAMRDSKPAAQVA